jgi:DNA repair protein RadA/Sms
LGGDNVYFGEASLSGAIRPVSHAAMRIKEAHKLGFTAAVAPGFGEIPDVSSGFRVAPLKHLSELAARILEGEPSRRGQRRVTAG